MDEKTFYLSKKKKKKKKRARGEGRLSFWGCISSEAWAPKNLGVNREGVGVNPDPRVPKKD